MNQTSEIVSQVVNLVNDTMSLGAATATLAGLTLVACTFERKQRVRPSKSLEKVRIPSIYRLGPATRSPRSPYPLLSPYLPGGITKQRYREPPGPARRVSYGPAVGDREPRLPHTAHYKRSDGRPCNGNTRLEHDIKLDRGVERFLVDVADALERYKQSVPALPSTSSAGPQGPANYAFRGRRMPPLGTTEDLSTQSVPTEPQTRWNPLRRAIRNVSRPKTPRSPRFTRDLTHVNAQNENFDIMTGAVGTGDQAAVRRLKARLGSGLTNNAIVCDADTDTQSAYHPWRIVSQGQLLDLIPWTNKNLVRESKLIPENFYTTYNVVAAFLKAIAEEKPTDDLIVDQMLGFGCLMDYGWVDVEYMFPEYPADFQTDWQKDYWTALKAWKEIATRDLGVEIDDRGEFVTESEKFFEVMGWEMQVPSGMKGKESNVKK